MKRVLAVVAGLLVLLLAEAAARAAEIVVMSSTGVQAVLEATGAEIREGNWRQARNHHRHRKRP